MLLSCSAFWKSGPADREEQSESYELMGVLSAKKFSVKEASNFSLQLKMFAVEKKMVENSFISLVDSIIKAFFMWNYSSKISEKRVFFLL